VELAVDAEEGVVCLGENGVVEDDAFVMEDAADGDAEYVGDDAEENYDAADESVAFA